MHSAGGDSLTEPLNTPPAAVEAERSLLGGLMLQDDTWDTISGRVSARDFYRNDHRVIFSAIQQLAERNEPRDAVTVAEFLEHNEQLVDSGGLQYLGLLVKDTPTAANILSYADIVRERSLLRELISVGNGIAASAFRPEGRSGKELVDEAEQAVYAIAEKGARSRREFVALHEVCSPLIDQLDELHKEGADITGLSTGFKKFDEITQGLQKGDLIILAGRPSMGKTTLALNIAENAAFRVSEPVSVAVFSMEMSMEQLALRFVSSLGRVPQGHLRNGKFGDDDWPRITTALQQMSQAPVFIDDTPGMSPGDLRSRARRLKRQHNIGLVIVDYLQLMQVPGTNENRTTEISNISRALKSLARELEVPVIALSQLNRSVEQRPDRRPVMSDLRESGAIEQDADLIVFIYRDEVYNKDTEKKGQADVIIAKHRNGETGDLPLTFLGQFSRFENFQREFDIPPDVSF